MRPGGAKTLHKASQIIFRRITGTDFFNIYKPPQAGGGGQSYIDSNVAVQNWKAFLSPFTPQANSQGYPVWMIPIHSLGSSYDQTVTIAQRRPSSVSIRSQKIESQSANRIRAWHPNYTSFPRPSTKLHSGTDSQITPLIGGLVVYLIRDTKNNFWAGWFKTKSPPNNWKVDNRLKPMFSLNNGHINLSPPINFHENEVNWPFDKNDNVSSYEQAKLPKEKSATQPASSIEEKILADLFGQDEASNLPPEEKLVVSKIRKRNAAAVKKLKDLYKGQCQISGSEFVFEKSDGTLYTEAHHLIPLGKGGFDSPLNLVVVSAHIHRMLHYANVSNIDVSKISDNRLQISINEKKFQIKWHPKHAEAVKSSLKNN